MLPILWLDFNHGNIAGSLPSELGLFCDLALLRLNPERSPERLLHAPPPAPQGRVLPPASRR